jgi:hypothetical protein
MISQLFVLTGDGDVIIQKDFRHELPRNSNEIFFSALKESKIESFFLTKNGI